MKSLRLVAQLFPYSKRIERKNNRNEKKSPSLLLSNFLSIFC